MIFFGGGGGGGCCGYDDTVGILKGHRKTGLFLGVISKFKVEIQNWHIFGGMLTFNYFGVCLILLILFFGVGECLVQVYVARTIESTPLPGGRIRRLHHFLLSFKADSHTTVHGFVFLL